MDRELNSIGVPREVTFTGRWALQANMVAVDLNPKCKTSLSHSKLCITAVPDHQVIIQQLKLKQEHRISSSRLRENAPCSHRGKAQRT